MIQTSTIITVTCVVGVLIFAASMIGYWLTPEREDPMAEPHGDVPQGPAAPA